MPRLNAPAWRFWVVTLAAVLTMSITASLGFWQLGRAQQKLALQAAIQERADRSPLQTEDLLALGAAASEHWHTPVRLRGRWESAHVVFLDNRQMQGVPGFYVLTPLRLVPSGQVVLIQRGWVARDFMERTRLPEVVTPDGETVVEGRLSSPPARLWAFDGEETGPIRQNIDLSDWGRETGLPLLPGVSVLQTGGTDGTLKQQWPEVATGVHKHHGYAVQWFALCALTGILYVWFQWISPRRKQRHHGPQDR